MILIVKLCSMQRFHFKRNGHVSPGSEFQRFFLYLLFNEQNLKNSFEINIRIEPSKYRQESQFE